MTLYERWKKTTIANQIMVVLTGIVCLLTLVNIVVTGIQLWDNSRQANRLITTTDGIKAALDRGVTQNKENLERTLGQAKDAMEASARQSKTALDASIENARLDQRAWVGIIGINRITEPKLNERLLFYVRLNNSGHSPGTNVRVHKTLSFDTTTINRIDPDHNTPERSRFAIGPGANFPNQTGTIPMPTSMLEAIIVQKRPLYLYGTAHYTTMGREATTTFCAIYVFQQPGDPGLEFCPAEGLNDMK